MLSGCLLIGAAVGGTMAWLVDETDTVANTFTVGDININLYEHKYDATNDSLLTEKVLSNTYEYVPGDVLAKDPIVEVEEGSEAAWLFIKVVEDGNITVSGTDATGNNVSEKALNYQVNTDIWKAVSNHEGYWYCEVDAANSDITKTILKDNEVKVSQYITKNNVSELANTTISFVAAAVQKDNITTVDAAWNALPTTFTSTSSN